jgi:hypothetical protein
MAKCAAGPRRRFRVQCDLHLALVAGRQRTGVGAVPRGVAWPRRVITLTQPKVPTEAKIRGSQKDFQWQSVVLGLERVPRVIQGVQRGPMGPPRPLQLSPISPGCRPRAGCPPRDRVSGAGRAGRTWVDSSETSCRSWAGEPKVPALVHGRSLWRFPYLEGVQWVLDGVQRGHVGPPGPLVRDVSRCPGSHATP